MGRAPKKLAASPYPSRVRCNVMGPGSMRSTANHIPSSQTLSRCQFFLFDTCFTLYLHLIVAMNIFSTDRVVACQTHSGRAYAPFLPLPRLVVPRLVLPHHIDVNLPSYPMLYSFGDPPRPNPAMTGFKHRCPRASIALVAQSAI